MVVQLSWVDWPASIWSLLDVNCTVICNMTVEAGATSGIVPADEETARYLKEEAGYKGPITPVLPDPDATYVRTLDIDVSKLVPQIACPHTVDNVKPIGEVEGKAVQQIVIGSCTNGRLDDLAAAADILRGKKVKKGTRMLVFPASSRILRAGARARLPGQLMKAGAVVMNSGCERLPDRRPPGGARRRQGGASADHQPKLQGAHGQPQVRGLSLQPRRGG